jgi:hypothetical protein
MRILLIAPPLYKHVKNIRFLEKTTIQTYTVPLGLGYIALVLEKAEYNVNIADAYTMFTIFVKCAKISYDAEYFSCRLLPHFSRINADECFCSSFFSGFSKSPHISFP